MMLRYKWEMYSTVDPVEAAAIMHEDWEPFAVCSEGDEYRIFLKRPELANRDEVPDSMVAPEKPKVCRDCKYVGQVYQTDVKDGAFLARCSHHRQVVRVDTYLCEDFKGLGEPDADPMGGAR